MTYRRWLTWLLVVAPVGGVCAFCLLYLWRAAPSLQQQAVDAMLAWVQRQWNTPLLVGNYSLYPLQQRIEMHNVLLGSSSQPLLVARQVLVAQTAPRQTDIRFEGATLHLVRFPDGTWNFSPLLPKRQLAPTDTAWNATFDDTTLHFTDYKAQPPLRTTLYGVKGYIYSSAGVTSFRFEHRQATPSFTAQVYGWVSHKKLRLYVRASQVPVAKLLSYLRPTPLDPSDAAVTGEVWIYTDERGEIQYAGSVSVEASQASWDTSWGRLRVQGLRGKGTFRTGIASWHAQAQVGTGTIEAQGTVQWVPTVVVVASGEVKRVPPLQLQPWLRRYAPQIALQAPVDAQVQVLAQGAQVEARVVAGISRIQVDKLVLQDLQVEAAVHQRGANVPRFACRIGGGRATGQAVVWTNRGEWQFAARSQFEQVSLAHLKPYIDQPVRGMLSGSAIAYGTTKQPRVVANVEATRLSGKGWRFERARARLRWNREMVRIDGALLEDWSGSVLLSGDVNLRQAQVALQVRVDEAQLGVWSERLAPYLPSAEQFPSGWAYARGQVVGSIQRPTFQGIVEVTDLRWRQWDVDYLVMRVQASPQQVIVEDAIIYRPPMEAKWRLEVENPLEADKARLVASGAAENVDLQEVLKSLREQEPPSVEAFARVFFYAEGPLRSPTILVTASAPVLQFQQWSASNLRCALRYQNNTLQVEALNAWIGDGQISVQGERSEGGQLRLQVEGSTLSLSPLRALLPEQVRPLLNGEMSFRGAVSGDERSPLFEGAVQVRNVQWDTVEVGSGSVQLAWRSDRLEVSDLYLASPTLNLTLRSLTFHSQQSQLAAEGRLTLALQQKLYQALTRSTWLQQQAPRLLDALREVEDLEGSIEIPFRLSGYTDRWQLQAQVSAEHLKLGEQSIGSLRARLTRTQDGEWQINRLDVVSGEHQVALWATYDTSGNLAFNLEGYNLRLGWLQRWLPTVASLEGVVESVTVEARGRAEAPTASLSLALRNLRYGNLQVQRLLTGKVEISEREVDISELWLVQPEGQVRIWGVVPFRWQPLGVPADEEIALNVEASAQPLKSLLAYVGGLQGLEAIGTWRLQARMAGTRTKPELFGEMLIEAERLRLSPMATALRQVRARLRLAEDTVFLEEISAFGDTTRGGRIAATGSLRLTAPLEEQLSGRLRLERFWLEERNLSGQYGEQIRAFVDGDLSVQGNPQRPVVRGIVSLSGGVFALPASFPAQGVEPRALAINPRFAGVVIRLHRGMWLNSPRLSTQASGDIALNGSLQEPLVHGQIGLERGYFYFPTARFRVEPGSTITLDYPVPGESPLRVHVSVKATTNLSLPSASGASRRYGVTVMVNGAISEDNGLRTEFRSEPPDLTPTQIARALGIGTIEELLGGRNIEQVLQREMVNLFTSAYIPQLFSPLERGIEEALQLSEFGLEYSRQEPLTITLVKRLWGGFSLSYWRTITAPRDRYMLKILYELPEWTRLARRLVISYSVDEKQQQRWGIEGTFRF